MGPRPAKKHTRFTRRNAQDGNTFSAREVFCANLSLVGNFSLRYLASSFLSSSIKTLEKAPPWMRFLDDHPAVIPWALAPKALYLAMGTVTFLFSQYCPASSK